MFDPVTQEYLDEARQMQALSFAVHIPLVCFGIAFPAMVLRAEWLWMRTGDEIYRVLAMRWTKVMVALFACGVVTGTILSFEMGLLWPGFMGTFGAVFGLGFALEGFSFFVEAIFIGIYVYGWNRMSPRAHFAVRLSDRARRDDRLAVRAGRERVDERPRRLHARRRHGHRRRPDRGAVRQRRTSATSSCTCTSRASSSPASSSPRAYAVGRLRGRWGRYERIALTIPLTVAALAAPVQVLVGDWAAREVAKTQPTKLAALEGVGHTERGAPLHLGGWYRDGEVKDGIAMPKGLSLLAFHDPNAEVQGLDAVPEADRPPVNVVRISFQVMVSIGTFLAALERVVPVHARAAKARAVGRLVLPPARARRARRRSSR